MRILVVDDDKDIRLFLSKILNKWGHKVVLASNGEEAWEILKKEEISFLITDWMMPKVSGIELCKKIRGTDFKHYIYIIMLTARDAKKELIEGMEAGADDFMVKP
ncbi:MAG: response regulator, partial [Deltaproteobacteria bacterium]|nr:response regulator [Deltaproteobacteria bacterium]